MPIIYAAIEAYHRLLQEGDMAVQTSQHLTEIFKQRGLFFGDRAICSVLRPHFYWHDSWGYLQQETALVLRAFAKAHHAAMEDANLRATLDLEPYEEELFSLDKGVKVPWTSSRLDAFYQSDTRYLKFVEYNAETPAGVGYGDELSDAFMQLEVMRRFQELYEVTTTPCMGELSDALLRGYHDWGGHGKPQIGIVDWGHVPTRREHEICREYFDACGMPSRLADPRELEYRDGHLYAGDFRIDMVYKRVLISELIREMGMNNPLVQAVKDRAVLMTNSFSAKLLAKKASLALLSDEANYHLFEADEIRAIEEHIPWTRRVSERRTIFHNQEIDMLPYVSQRKELFVLKPNDEYGGAGVRLGWETEQSVWDQALKDALTTPHVLQERVDPVYRDYPSMVDGRLEISPRFVDADPYVFYGEKTPGCLTRLSSAALLNVTAGKGSVVPMFMIRKR